ncbi:MAG: hypothetical protein QOG07_3524 [Pseudonocardiales bacterium]|nr:hypothetical protein [Pseudonocardiales bacterium]
MIAGREGALAQRALESGLPRAGFGDITSIGVGSLATVYRARELATNRIVALKVLDTAGVSPRARESFERESLVLGALSSHPNVVTFYRSFALPDGRPVLVLELCHGSVAERQRSPEGISVQEAVAIAIKIAGALETAHRGGVLHCDVKPQNVLMTEFGEPALADFGVAMLQSSTQLTAGLFDFTNVHVAPELLEGGPTSAATDVYELGSMLYELVAGSSAFHAYAGEPPASVILRILRDPVRPVVSETVPQDLSDLLVWSMAKGLRERPPSIEFFAFELDRIEAAQGWPRTAFLVRDIGAPVTVPRARSAAARRLTQVPPAAPLPPSAQPVAARPPATAATPPQPVAPVFTTPLPAPPRPAAPLASASTPSPESGETAPPALLPLTAGPRHAVHAADPWLSPRVVLRASLFAATRPVLATVLAVWLVAIVTVAVVLTRAFGGGNSSAALVVGVLSAALSITAAAAQLGRPTLVLNARRLQHRNGLRRIVIPWDSVMAFDGQLDQSRRSGSAHGVIVVFGGRGSMPLAATRRQPWEIASLYEQLEAYRSRMQAQVSQ